MLRYPRAKILFKVPSGLKIQAITRVKKTVIVQCDNGIYKVNKKGELVQCK